MMQFHNSIYRAAAVAIKLLLGLLLFACSDDFSDQPAEVKYCTVTISLQSSGGMHSVTKADEESDTVKPSGWENEDKYERNISDWLVVAYNSNGQLEDYIGSFNMPGYNANDEDSETDIQMTFPIGETFTFYAFANLDNLEKLKDGTAVVDYIIGSSTVTPCTEDELRTLAVQVGNIDSKFNGDQKQLIPMSSYGYTWTMKATDNEFSIPLIRMIGKVRVKVQNALTENVTINQITIGKFQENRPLYLKPYETVGENGVGDKYLEFAKGFDDYQYEHRGPSFPTEVLDYTKSYALNLGENGVTIVPNTTEWTVLPTCYVDESRLHSETERSSMAITIGRSGANGEVTTTSATDFYFVRRNDLLEIPLLLTDLTTKLTFGSQRIPIGVYPTEVLFGGEANVQVLTPVTYPSEGNLTPGELTIKYKLTSARDGWKIRYVGDTAIGSAKYSSITLVNNDDKLLIDDNNNVIDCSSASYPISFVEKGDDSGSFTIRTQELANYASAEIRLTLIVLYNEGQNEIEIPYTIRIQNKKSEQQSTN